MSRGRATILWACRLLWERRGTSVSGERDVAPGETTHPACCKMAPLRPFESELVDSLCHNADELFIRSESGVAWSRWRQKGGVSKGNLNTTHTLLATVERLTPPPPPPSQIPSEMLSNSKCNEFASSFSEKINNIRKEIGTSSSYAEGTQIWQQFKKVTMSVFETDCYWRTSHIFCQKGALLIEADL